MEISFRMKFRRSCNFSLKREIIIPMDANATKLYIQDLFIKKTQKEIKFSNKIFSKIKETPIKNSSENPNNMNSSNIWLLENSV